MNNAEISAMLRQHAAVLALEGADRFRIKAYQRGALIIETLDEDLEKLVADDSDLTQIPGIGKGIASAISEIVKTGKLERMERSAATLSPEQVELAAYPALDPKKVQRIYKKLKIHGVSALRMALEKGEIAEKLGRRLDFHVRQGLDERPRMLLYDAEKEAPSVERFLRSLTGVEQTARAGSLRRKKDTVGDLGFLVAAKNTGEFFERFTASRLVKKVLGAEENSVLVQLGSGTRCRVTTCKPAEWGGALVRETGSDAHTEDLTKKSGKKTIKAKTEEEFYRSLGLAYIEPELREGRGEIEAAARNTLPHLVTLENIRGDLHMHTTESDGANSLAEMAAAAKDLGYEYIAISDHSQSLKLTNGLTEARLLKQCEAIDACNERAKGIVVLKSSEVDILEDGSLDFPKRVLKELDLCICSIHSRFGLDKEKQTARIMRAMDNPFFRILGHATGRLLLKREGYDLDMEKILRHAKESGCFVEINASPDRLDLSDEAAKLAKDIGVKIAVNTDAHSTDELLYMQAGINQARRAWLEPDDVLNTRTVKELLKLLKR